MVVCACMHADAFALYMHNVPIKAIEPMTPTPDNC